MIILYLCCCSRATLRHMSCFFYHAFKSFMNSAQVFINLLLNYSESSMFVSKRRWILKTCGTTTPLECIEPLIQMAENAGYKNIEYLFYSRKNFKRPDLQVSPHRTFEEEVNVLDSFFDNGRAYCLGSINHDCWYLYTYSREGGIALQSDQTIEILMTDLDPDVMAIFTKEESKNAAEATEVIYSA